jgi:anti-sigma regulatory factor (Ser/Thr protein kinase)
MPLEEIVRSAVSETEDYARVSAVRLPDTQVSAVAVTDLVHLLAELIDNATSFSPPDSPVSVHGNFVGRGVAVEVEDQGLGIGPEVREELNELLRESAGFQQMALAGRRHLGLFVVSRLARRHSISVSLQESAYGGIKAVVLIPAELLPGTHGNNARAQPLRPVPAERSASRRHELPASTLPALGPATRSRSGDTATVRTPQPPRLDTSPRPAPHRSPGIPRSNRPDLPQRRRQTHLSPQLQLGSGMPEPVDEAPAGQRRNADVMRNSMTAFQRGTRQARNSAQPPH